MKIKAIRTVASTQIGPHGSTLDAARSGCTLELKTAEQCILAKGNFNGTTYREFYIPLAMCCHIELEPEVLVPALERKPQQTASGKLEVPADPPPPSVTVEMPKPEPHKEPFRAPKKY